MAAATRGVILAGGAGTRLGRTKPSAPLGGRPLIGHALGALEAAGLEAVVVAKAGSEIPEMRVPVWREPDEDLHPLRGIVHALELNGAPVVVVGCDMPFVAPALIASLADRREPLVVPEAGGRLHPLLARYAPSLLGALRAAIASPAPLQATVRALDAVVVGEDQLRRFGDPDRLTFNVNTPQDLERAEVLLRA
jgi:molybdopterin-guanine dinucleotide biosynthesis protein A